MNNFNTVPSKHQLLQLAEETNKSLEEVHHALVLHKKSKKEKKLPEWATKYIQVHKTLQGAIDARDAVGTVPSSVMKVLKNSQDLLRTLAQRVSYAAFLKAILPSPETVYADTTKLLLPLQPNTQPGETCMAEWEINFGLLYSIYLQAKKEEEINIVRFLMINFLAKAAYLNLTPRVQLSDEQAKAYKEMVQGGALTMGGLYHRSAHKQTFLNDILGITNRVGSADERAEDLVALDTMEVSSLYSLSFTVLPALTKREEVINLIVSTFKAHLEHFPKSNINFPFLMDVTEQIGQSLITEGAPEKIKVYRAKQKKIRSQINGIIQEAVKEIQKEHPAITHDISDYIKMNTAIVSRAKINDHIAVLGLHKSLFTDSDFKRAQGFDLPPRVERHQLLSDKVKTWVTYTATSLGAVHFRACVAERLVPTQIMQFGEGRSVTYAVAGKRGVILYKRPKEIMETNIIKTLTRMADGKEPRIPPAQTLLVKATLRMIDVLMNRIEDKKWEAIQKSSILRELTQNALFRTMQHLASALQHLNDFRKFSQALDCTHTELTTFLMIYSPFNAGDFETSYRQFLKPNFPTSLTPQVVGIAKSALNVFAGINAAIFKVNPHPVRVCGAHTYYEEVELVGKTQTLQAVLEDPKIDKIDFYSGEFYHNIDNDPSYTTYHRGTVIEDVRTIFKKKPKTDRLTCVIDTTINYTQSEELKEFVQTFEKEIREGKLTLAGICSGQKFDLLGFDHYYGSPFYIIHNGDKKWDEFNKIKTEEAFHTDELSLQFFSWITQSVPELVDQYKKLIFDNTRAILELVPSELNPDNQKELCVCTFDENVKTPFIDIKINYQDKNKREEVARWVQQRFIELFTSEGKLVYARGSFGFHFPNIIWIDPKMRINPGIDPEEVKIYKRFFADLVDKVY